MNHLNQLSQQLGSLFEENVDDNTLRDRIKGILPADLAAIVVDFSNADQIRIFGAIEDQEDRSEFLSFLEGSSLDTILTHLEPEKVAAYLESLPPDEAVDLLEAQTEDVVQAYFKNMQPETVQELTDLRKYAEGTAGSLMTTDFLSVRSHAKIKDILHIIRDDEVDLETIDVGFVLTEGGKILGKFFVHDMLGSSETAFVLKFIEEDFLYVKDTDSQDVVLQLMARHALSIIPVVDHAGVMKGIITADDMLDVAREVMDQDFYQMVGTSGDPSDRSIAKRVMHRAPWLACTLFAGSVSATIMKAYQMELELFYLIAVFIPFVNGMAGNVGVQSATIIVRDLVNQSGSRASTRKNIGKEILTGISNACLFGLLTLILLSLAGYFMHWPSPWIGVIISSGLMLSMFFASLIGATIPILFNRIGIDPAISSGPIITALIDIIGLSIYLISSTTLLKLFEIHKLSGALF